MTNKKAKNTGLGRGIDALFADINNVNDIEQVEELDLDKVRPNPYQPRKTFDADSLKELAESIRENGVFQPIIVRASINGYEIIAGERRYRASKLAKKETIPAIVREMEESTMMEIAVIENLQREDLTPLEEAQAYEMLQKNLGLTQDQVSKRVGKSRPYIANYLRLLSLPMKTKKSLQAGDLSMGQARTLLGLRKKEDIDTLASRTIKEGLTVRQLETLVAKINEAGNETVTKPIIKKSPFVRESEAKLADKFGTKVNITETTKGKGKLSIDFVSTDDLNRILDILAISLD